MNLIDNELFFTMHASINQLCSRDSDTENYKVDDSHLILTLTLTQTLAISP